MAPALLPLALACGGEAPIVELSSPAAAPPSCVLSAPISSLTLIEARAGKAAVVRCPGGGLATLHPAEVVGLEGGAVAQISGDAVVIERPPGGAERWILRSGGPSANFHVSSVAPPQQVPMAQIVPGEEEGGSP